MTSRDITRINHVPGHTSWGQWDKYRGIGQQRAERRQLVAGQSYLLVGNVKEQSVHDFMQVVWVWLV